MNKSFSFGIARRLYALSIVISLALVALAGFAYVNLQEAYSKAEQTQKLRVPQLSAMASLELSITRVSLQVRHSILARTPQELEATLADIGAKRKLIADTMAVYEKSLFTEKGKAQFAQLPPLMDKFWKTGEENIALIKNGQKAEAFAFLVDRTIPARNDLLQVIAEGVKYQEEALGSDIATVEDRVKTTSTAMLVLVAVIAVGLLAFSAWVAGQLRRRVALAQATAERVRDGDLSTAVRDDGHDEFSPLLAALGDMQSSLSRVVAEVRGSAESVATASTQIAQGNEDLSGRTEQQAAALEETNSTTTTLGTTAQQNADSARQASQLAASASSVAVQGGEVVGQVVQTMKDINDSSRKINDIIGVIDGIAFQTNILALNAAVEAARAGEQGRGFAVVAGEVRSLAQRSAEAAKEIKGLIGTSVDRVEAGTRLVSEAGQTMDEIVASVQRVTDVISEIGAATGEQSQGIAQVGSAVAQLDQMTQQNAALVEESAAAAQSLRDQAQRLAGVVATFRLSA